MNSNNNLSRNVKIALLAAIAVVLMYVNFPVIPMFSWLQIDLSDVPALMGAFAFGPITGVVIELLKNLLILFIKGTTTGFVGELANFIVGVSLILPASMIYHKNKSKKSAVFGMFIGTISIEIIGILANVYLLLPAFGMSMAKEELINYILVGLIPFNGIKAILVSLVTYILYKRVSVSIFKVEPMLDSKLKDKLS